MIPDDRLSSQPVIAPFVGAKLRRSTKTLDFEDGGIALNDPSEGNQYQVWRGRLIGNDVVLDAPEADPVIVYSGENITEISFSFDQNMRPVVAFQQDGISKLFWFDSVAGQQVVTEYEGALSPKVVLDDKRATQTNNSDVIFGYIREENLYYRQQRDRFLIERLLAPAPRARLEKIGLNTKLRLQFQLRQVP